MTPPIETDSNLIGAIRADIAAGHAALDHAAEHYANAGDRLRELKASVGHGQWVPTLEHLGITPRSAQRYMTLAKARASAPGLWEPGASLRSALRGPVLRTCDMCGVIEPVGTWLLGNNAAPVVAGGRCCATCNEVVFGARWLMVAGLFDPSVESFDAFCDRNAGAENAPQCVAFAGLQS